ncbi:hypothetical protein PHLCEN_2v12295 [Hermanssonia centrifuga]|uniref:Major facilitator superfamily (MFS) profile domain-containing protein n=1 Tax=Hermanssonia centrifuga TaxID=98765 RepID=A0A2R6NHD7_9APHY|nr:hypothetical protein PHLCEN_2v12295 [Hermanssonia centrifuga]
MSCENKEVIRPGTAGSDKSDSTKKTQVQFERDQAQDGGHEKVGQMQNITNGPQDGDESAIPEDRKEDAIENAEDDWVHDPRNPRNWSFWRKWEMVSIVSLYTFVTPLASSMMAPALPEIGEHLGITSETVIAMTLSIFLLTFAIGPLFLAPLSEIYGRTWMA